ncbi:S-layer homology domain-containing protein [Tissierella sp.]|uniref:S-layer homology domain-containing protein n=1 Tax=Tissierella sp. TaxID=41274 RepID=UPI0028ABA939|nr:S-layer homology domain-containing protein [Tissierella sp.]
MKKVKLKALMFVMILTLLITGIPLNGFAEEDSLDKNIQKVKALFKIGDEYDYFDKHQYDRSSDKKITSLSWRNKDKHIGVDIDEDGNIIGYWKNERSINRNTKPYKFPKTTKKQGEKVARDFIKKLYPDILDKIIYQDEDNAAYLRNDLREYNYSFARREDDIPFYGNNVYISVDTQTGEVNSFNINWEKDLKFEDAKNIISKDEAKNIYKDNMDLELLYKVKETDKNMESYLAYSVKETDKTVDAKTKDIISTSYIPRYSIYGGISRRNMEKISIEEENKLINSKKIIGRKESSEKIINTFKLGKEYEIEGHKLLGNKEKDIYIWEVMIMKRVGNHGSGTSMSVNAKTGEIIDFSDPGSWDDADDKEPKYSKEELLEKAKELIKNNSPEKYKKVEYIENEDKISFYNEKNISGFLFVRKENDLKVENDGYRIVLSNVTGNVQSYNFNWSDLEFESPNNIIEKDEAKEILLGDKELVLEYQLENSEKEKKNVKLVYDFKDKYLAVDAKNSEIVDNIRGLMEKAAIKGYKDTENSFAKNQINKLQEYIVLFEGEEFKPKQEITQKEFLQLLAQTKYRYYFYEDSDYIYERFVDEGILKEEEKNMGAKVTREEAIKYIVRAFGQEPLEDLKGIYKLEYDDADKISTNLKGHIAIAEGLGLISGKGNFRPKDNLTREEAVLLIYNILNRDI